MAARFWAARLVLELNKLKSNKLIHISLPRLPSKYYCASPRAYLGSCSASPLEHFALMKRCHVSSDVSSDGLKVHNLLRGLWHGSSWRGGLPQPVRREETCVCQKKAQRCDWCRWTTTFRQSSIWISRSLPRWNLQYQQFADGIWTSEHDHISVSFTECFVFFHGAWRRGKWHFWLESYCFCNFCCIRDENVGPNWDTVV